MEENQKLKGLSNLELVNKVNVLEGIIKNLNEESLLKKEELRKLTQELNLYNDQIEYYQRHINQTAEDENDEPTETGKFLSDKINESDQALVYETLKKRLEEISQSLTEVKSFPNNKNYFNKEPLYFPCIRVDFIESLSEEKPLIRTQTFRIMHQTKVAEICENTLNLYDLLEKKNDYKLYLIDGENQRSLNDGDVINQLFKTNKTQIKSPLFVLAQKNFKNNFADEGQEEQKIGKDIIIVNNTNDSYIAFTRMIVGVTDYIRRKFITLREKERKGNPDDEQKKNTSWIYLLVHAICFVLFFIFSIISTANTNNPYLTFITSNAIEESLVGASSLSNTQENLGAKLSLFTQDKIKGTHNKLVSLARISFYRAKDKTCNKNFKQNKDQSADCSSKLFYNCKTTQSECFHPFYKKFSTDSFLDVNFGGSCIDSYGGNSTETSCGNFFKETALRGFTSSASGNYEVDKTGIKGKYGKYTGEEAEEIFISLNYITDGTVIENLLQSLKGEVDGNCEGGKCSTNILEDRKAIVVDLTLSNIETNIYYYVSFYYEFSHIQGSPNLTVDVRPFVANFKDIKNGKLIYVLDIFRIIFSIAIFLIMIKFSIDRYSVENELKRQGLPGKNIFQVILKMDIFPDFIIFLLYIILIAFKFNKLMIDRKKAEKVTQHSSGAYVLNSKEYYPILIAYENVMALEGVVFIFLLLRAMAYAGLYLRLRNFNKYLRAAFMRIIPFFCMFIVLVAFFAIFAHVLSGENYEGNVDYSSSYMNVLSYSIGHFRGSFTSTHTDYEVVFNVMFFVIIVFFFVQLIFGIATDSYRLNSLKMGSIYNQRLKKQIRSSGVLQTETPLNSRQN